MSKFIADDVSEIARRMREIAGEKEPPPADAEPAHYPTCEKCHSAHGALEACVDDVHAWDGY